MTNKPKTGRTFWDFAAEQPDVIVAICALAAIATVFSIALLNLNQ